MEAQLFSADTVQVLAEEGVDLDQVGEERRRVLVVEDEPDTVYLLKQILRIAGFNVLSAYNGREALKKVAEHKPDVVLLDIMMPEMDGWETLGYLRKMTEAPVVVISALGEKEEVVEGLRRGVDDYITKPFYNAEVVARVETVLRRARRPQEVSRLVFPGVEMVVDMLSQQVVIGGKEVQLTPKEFALMAVMAKHAPAIVSYPAIAEAVWGEDNADVRKRTKYLVYLLRRKFEGLMKGRELIVNVGRYGYKLQTEE
jgi:DNA-binding response OmpR family regulator